MRPVSFWRIIVGMASYRFDNRARSAPATVGDVFLAISEDEEMRAKLGDIYETLFRRGAGGRRGTEWGPEVPDHYFFVTPKKARGEINEVSSWIRERFGDPARTPTETTPFGYLGPGNGSYRYDGWVVFFAVLVHGQELDLAKYFTGDIAGMSWASHSASMRAANGVGVPSAPATSTTSASSPAPAPLPPLLQPARVRGRYPSPSTGRVIIPPAPEKPGVLERVFGVKLVQVAPPTIPAPSAPLVPQPVFPVTSMAASPAPVAPSPQVSRAATWTEEEEEENRRTFEAVRGQSTKAATSSSPEAGIRWVRDLEVEALKGEVEKLRKAVEGEEVAGVASTAVSVSRRRSKKSEGSVVSETEVVKEDDEVLTARAKRTLDEAEERERQRRKVEAEAVSKLSTAEKLKRPEGPFGG